MPGGIGLNNDILITSSSTWTLPAAGFSNPMYVTTPALGSSDATGFDISGAGTVSVAFEGTYTGQTVVHQQTMDPAGVAGWFNVEGVASDGSTSSTSGSVSGQCYNFAAQGSRHRIQVTALSTGTIAARITLSEESLVVLNTTTGSGASSTQVQGAQAAGANAGTNPVQVGAQDPAGVVRALVSDPSGHLVVGTIAPGAPITAASGNVANASAVATLAGAAGKTTYITGFELTAGGATGAALVQATVAGVLGGTLTYIFGFPAGVTTIATPLIVEFPEPIPASAANTAIVVTLPAGGTGNTNAAAVAHGFQL